MKKTSLGLAICVLTGAAMAQELTKVPVHDKPVWQVVAGMPDAPGQPVVVRSLSTNQPLGTFPVDTRFMSFGGNGQIVTTAINGEMVYLPSTAVSRLYPVVQKPAIPPPGPDTLEELANAYEERMTGQVGVSLDARDSLIDRAKASQPMVGQGATPGMPGTTFGGGVGVNPYSNTQPMPGAALAQGGVQGVGAMVGSGGGYGSASPYGPMK